LGGGLALLEREDTPPPPPPAPGLNTRALLESFRPTERQFTPVTDTDTLSITGLLVEELWNLSPDEDILGWTPSELDATLVRNGVRKRKIVAIGALGLVALIAGWRALTWDDARTAESIEAVTATSAELVTQLGGLDGTIGDLIDGTMNNPLGASTALARMDEAARELFSVAGDLPIDDETAPIREQAISQAGGSLELATMLSESVAYASAVDLITRPVDLPASTDIDGLPGVTEVVTGWVNDFTAGVGSLPGNELTDTHRAALEDLAASLPDWQADYLDALRARDTAQAEGHVAALDAQIAFVRGSWSDAARSIAEWAEQRTAALAVPLIVNR
jgi:hypothetical protein